jgi:hypothetical protein
MCSKENKNKLVDPVRVNGTNGEQANKVKLQDRCPLCGRALFKEQCSQDGSVIGIADLGIPVVHEMSNNLQRK